MENNIINKYEEALECPNCVLGLNCKTCKKKMVLQEAVKKAQAINKALELIKQKRDNAELDLEKGYVAPRDRLIGIIGAYTDCIITIETELGRK